MATKIRSTKFEGDIAKTSTKWVVGEGGGMRVLQIVVNVNQEQVDQVQRDLLNFKPNEVLHFEIEPTQYDLEKDAPKA